VITVDTSILLYAHRILVTVTTPPDIRKTPTRSIILLAVAGFASQASPTRSCRRSPPISVPPWAPPRWS